jgi:hypothetical protein
VGIGPAGRIFFLLWEEEFLADGGFGWRFAGSPRRRAWEAASKATLRRLKGPGEGRKRWAVHLEWPVWQQQKRKEFLQNNPRVETTSLLNTKKIFIELIKFINPLDKPLFEE